MCVFFLWPLPISPVAALSPCQGAKGIYTLYIQIPPVDFIMQSLQYMQHKFSITQSSIIFNWDAAPADLEEHDW